MTTTKAKAKAKGAFRPITQQIPYIALAVYVGLFALPIPVAVSILPLLLASLALSLDSAPPRPGPTVSIRDHRVIMVLVFVICHTMSVLLSQNLLKSAQSFALFLPGALVAFLTLSLSQQQEAKVALIRGITVCIGVVSGLYCLMYLENHDKGPADILVGLNSFALVVPNDLSICVILLPFLILGLSLEKTMLLKPLYWLVLLLFMVAMAISGSRLCIAGTALLIVLFLGRKRENRVLVPFVLLLGLLTISAIDIAIQTGIMRKLAHLIEHNGRLSVWYVGLTHWADYPWLGVGPGGFEAVYSRALFDDSIPQWMSIDRRMVSWTHSLVIEALLERGIAGLIAFLVFGFAIFRVFAQRTKNGRFDFNMAVLLSFIMFSVIGVLELTLQRNWVVIILCLYIGLYLSGPPPRQTRGNIDCETAQV